MGFRLLAVHADPALGKLVNSCLEPGGFFLRTVKTGSEAFDEIINRAPDIVVVELSLPDIDGLVWLKILRQTKEGKNLPVIMASAKHAEEGTVQAFELGADDYITYRSCDPRELIARLRAVLRRRRDKEERATQTLHTGPVRLDHDRHLCLVRGKSVELRPREFEVLEMLMGKSGRVLSRAYLLEGIWGMSRQADTRTVDVTISRLRKALGKRAGNWIQTVERFGYRFRDPNRKDR